MKRLATLVVLLAVFSAAIASVPVMRIGMLNFEQEASYQGSLDNVQHRLAQYLQRVFPGYQVQVQYCTTEELTERVRRRDVDYFLGSSGFFVALQSEGVKDLVTLARRLHEHGLSLQRQVRYGFCNR